MPKQKRKWTANSSECSSVNSLLIRQCEISKVDKGVRRGIPLMSECVPRRDGGQQQLPHGTHLTTEYLSKTSSSLLNNMLPTARLMLVIWQKCLLNHSAAGCWHSHHGAGVISSHPDRWKVVYIETERQYHMVAPGDRPWWELSHIKPNSSLLTRALSYLPFLVIFVKQKQPL